MQDRDRVRLSVQDWGIGFDLSERQEGRFGLESIRQRAHLFGGYVKTYSQLGEGTKVVVEVDALSEPCGPPD